MTRQAESEHHRSSDDAEIRPLGSVVSSALRRSIKAEVDLLCVEVEPGHSPSLGRFRGIAAMRSSIDRTSVLCDRI